MMSNDTVFSIAFLLVIVIVLLPLFLLFGLRGKRDDESVAAMMNDSEKRLYHYARKRFFMTQPEQIFFEVLMSAVDSWIYVFPQVHLSTILDYDGGGRGSNGAHSHINGKSVDFVLCDKRFIRPILAVELDDSSHDRQDRVDRDVEVERIFSEAGLPLLRIRNHERLNRDQLASLVHDKLADVHIK